MNKNTIIGSILMAVIVIWWMTTNSANANAKAAAEAKAREAAAAEAAKSETADQLVLPVAEPEVKAAPVLGAPAADKAPADSAVADSSTAAADSATADSVAAKPVILPRTVTVETDKFIVTLDNKGGKVRSVIVKALADSAGNFPELIQDTTLGALDLTLGKADLSEALFAVDAPEWISVDADTSVQFVFEDVGGNKVIRSCLPDKARRSILRYVLLDRIVIKFILTRFFSEKSLYRVDMSIFTRSYDRISKYGSIRSAGYVLISLVDNIIEVRDQGSDHMPSCRESAYYDLIDIRELLTYDPYGSCSIP